MLLSQGIKMQTRPVCASGWILSDDELSCQKVDTMSPETTGDGNLLVKHYQLANYYGIWGTIFYKYGLYNYNGTFNYTLDDTSTYVNYYNDTASVTNNGLNYIEVINTLWNNPPYRSITYGRLNKCGLWLSTDQSYVGTLGFSRQFTISTGGIYYIGFGSDNYTTIKIDGTTIIQQDLDALKTQFNTTYDLVSYGLWHVYPVYLTSGIHTITITNTNINGPGILGAEIYNGTEEQLIGCTTETQLDEYTIFSTKNILDGEKFDIGNYYCTNPDYQLIYDSSTQTYYCRKIETTKPNYIS